MDAKVPDAAGEEISIGVAATFTADLLEVPLRFWLEELRQPASLQFAPYGQLFQQLLAQETSRSLAKNRISICLVRLDDWSGHSSNTAPSSLESEIKRNVGDFLQGLRAAAERTAAAFLVGLCPSSRNRTADSERCVFLSQMEQYLAWEAEQIPGVHVLRHEEVERLYPVRDFRDDYMDALAHVPYTPVYFTALATMIARKIYALRKRPHKVLVLDCDSTLWDGVCAEDGAAGVQIGSQRRALQEFVSRQHDAGMLLCLCSKNNEEDVQAVFERHPGMILRRDHFIASRINWRPKSENLRSMAGELNLGLDSFILIDDDPVECAEVKAHCPEVLAIQLPRNTELLPAFLDHLWVFDHSKITAEDERRTQMYRDNIRRDSLRQNSLTFGQFLAEIELQVDQSSADAASLPRVSALTCRTNQFNLSTIRRSESELRALQQEGKDILTVHVRDRFGDYGLVGVVVWQLLSRALAVDTFLLSCRAMGRGVEHQMLARLGTIAMERGADEVELRFIPTAKNKPCHDFLESLADAVKEPCEGGWRYRVPGSVAAICRFEPDKATLPTEEMPETASERPAAEKDSPSEYRPHSGDELLVRIALKLNRAEAIHEVISSGSRERPDLAVSFQAPASPVEREIVAVWSECLGIEPIGIHDNFFDLGGHSLLAMQVLARLQGMFHVELSPRLLVTQEFTVATLSQAVLTEQIRQAGTSELGVILEQLDALSVEELKELAGMGGRK